jgi:hypothetical protein
MTARQIFLPQVPDNIVEQIRQSARELVNVVEHNDKNYIWAAANQQVQQWCRQNISPDMYWGVQIIDGHLAAHKDQGTQAKFNYIIDAAGQDVVTNFYDDDMKLVETVHFLEHTWYILDVTMLHEVVGVKHGQVRLSLTGRIFPTTRI